MISSPLSELHLSLTNNIVFISARNIPQSFIGGIVRPTETTAALHGYASFDLSISKTGISNKPFKTHVHKGETSVPSVLPRSYERYDAENTLINVCLNVL
jgi:hypothetical protein